MPKKNNREVSAIYLDKNPDLKSNGTVSWRNKHQRKIVFGWYGGKFSHLDWLLPLLSQCHHYCEPFAGSAAVLLNRDPSPVETYNDIDGELVNFFRVLRDNSEEFIKVINFTPFSREEYYLAIYEPTENLSPVERARRFYIRARQNTAIKTDDCFSGRTYDEKYLTNFINQYNLPCNSTTAFLTPAFRNLDQPLTSDLKLNGKPPQLYVETLSLLDDVYQNKIEAETLLVEIIRVLLIVRYEKLNRLAFLTENLKSQEGLLPLSSEAIVKLIKQHLECKNSSRLPVLIVAAAYKVAENKLREKIIPLKSHNAADSQTGAIGDLEICMVGNNQMVTVYEMKMKQITKNDLDIALAKVTKLDTKIDNYIFITTDKIDDELFDYAVNFYQETGGIEFVILDCISFLRHFLHLFHRIRIDFLNTYQELLLNEPDSAVSQALKEEFLALRITFLKRLNR